MPPDANWNAAMTAFTRGNMAEAARRFELVADASPDRASSWTLAAGSFWAARANLLAGNPQKYAPYLKRAALHGRTFYGLVAQKALGMQIQPDFEVPALDRKRTDMLRDDRAARRALALLQLGATTAAERELFAASIDADPRYVEAVMALAQKAQLPACRCASATPTGTSVTTSRATTAACIRSRRGNPRAARVSTVHWSMPSCARNRRSIQGALGRGRDGPDAADAGHGARGLRALCAGDRGGQSLGSVGEHVAGPGLHLDAAQRDRRQSRAHDGGLQWRAGQRDALGQFAERLAGSAPLYPADPAPRDARLRAARAHQLLDLPASTRPADAVARPDRLARLPRYIAQDGSR